MTQARQLEWTHSVDVHFEPPRQRQPVEVFDRSSLLRRMAKRELTGLQRTLFHQLWICTHGQGTHVVDYMVLDCSPGTMLRLHPGQVHQFSTSPNFEARMVVWPTEHDPVDPDAAPWFPGNGTPTSWQLDEDLFVESQAWIEQIRQTQERFDGSLRYIKLMEAMLCSLLLRLAADVDEPVTLPVGGLPDAYLAYRNAIETALHSRPTVTGLARGLGYHTRTLDRACRTATGQTAKQVLDERITLEVRRSLTHSDRSLSEIASNFGFTDYSNFSKFVIRQLGSTPAAVRDAVQSSIATTRVDDPNEKSPGRRVL